MRYPPLGPEPLLLTRREIDELYTLLAALQTCFQQLAIPYIMIGGSLLGAIRSQSILFNDDDIDVAILLEDDDDPQQSVVYQRLLTQLPILLQEAARQRTLPEHAAAASSSSENGSGPTQKKTVRYHFQHRPWVACDRVRSSAASRVWIDVFVMRPYRHGPADLRRVLQKKDNGQDQPSEYVEHILTAMRSTMSDCDEDDSEEWPLDDTLYHFDTRKALELWPREYLWARREIHPIQFVPFGPLTVPIPAQAVPVLRRFFGADCFTHYTVVEHARGRALQQPAPPVPVPARKVPLQPDHYWPVQHSRRDQRVWSTHNQATLWAQIAAALGDSADSLPPPMPLSTPSGSSVSPAESDPVSPLEKSVANSSITKMNGETPYANNLSSDSNDGAGIPEPTRWFGYDVRRWVGKDLPDFQDAQVRTVMEPHVAKARRARQEALRSSPLQDPAIPYRALRQERSFYFDPEEYPLRRILEQAWKIPDLARFHEYCPWPDSDQKRAFVLKPLLESSTFQEAFDHLILAFVVPYLHQLALEGGVLPDSADDVVRRTFYRYQAFPCLRIVRPGEFSIGPHCDAAYGHSVGNLNFHIPLTDTWGTNALFVESEPGREDWHPLLYKRSNEDDTTTCRNGKGFLFDGARCLHFTLENTTDCTRVSIDFRVAIHSGPDPQPADLAAGTIYSSTMLEDRFSTTGPGYYDEAVVDMNADSPTLSAAHDQIAPQIVVTKSHGQLVPPDKRVGFPFG